MELRHPAQRGDNRIGFSTAMVINLSPRRAVLRSIPKVVIVVLCLALIVALGLLRLVVGPEYAFSALYLIPILTGTWFVGRHTGLVLAFASTLSWLSADVWLLHWFSKPWVPVINEVLRLAVFVGVAVMMAELQRALKRAQELALTDPLTGVPNRRAFFEVAEGLVELARRQPQPIALVFFDANNFKEINDRLGHRVGDEVLRRAAQAIRANLRAADVVARAGGDEFLVLLPNTGLEQAHKVADKLQACLDREMRQHGWSMTFCHGVAASHRQEESIEDLVRRADELMYRAKVRYKGAKAAAGGDAPRGEEPG
jgi:diguanylate cyclase (GGDEF)-like protein